MSVLILSTASMQGLFLIRRSSLHIFYAEIINSTFLNELLNVRVWLMTKKICEFSWLFKIWTLRNSRNFLNWVNLRILFHRWLRASNVWSRSCRCWSLCFSRRRWTWWGDNTYSFYSFFLNSFFAFTFNSLIRSISGNSWFRPWFLVFETSLNYNLPRRLHIIVFWDIVLRSPFRRSNCQYWPHSYSFISFALITDRNRVILSILSFPIFWSSFINPWWHRYFIPVIDWALFTCWREIQVLIDKLILSFLFRWWTWLLCWQLDCALRLNWICPRI